MSTIDSAGNSPSAFGNKVPTAGSDTTSGLSFANSVKKATATETGKPIPGAATAQLIANTGRDLDNPGKLAEFMKNPGKRQAVQKQLSQLTTDIKGDLSLDPIAQLPARDLAIIRGFYSLLNAEKQSRLEIIR